MKENFSSLSTLNILTLKRLWHTEQAFKYFSPSDRDLGDKSILKQQSAVVKKVLLNEMPFFFCFCP